MARKSYETVNTYQVRDLTRVVNRLQKKLDNHILKDSKRDVKVASAIASLTASAVLEEE